MHAKLLLVFSFLFLLSFTLVFAGGVSGTPQDELTGANLSLGNSVRYAAPSSSSSSAGSGNVSFVDVSSSYSTERWAGFYGNVSAEVILGDVSNTLFYRWTVQDLTGSYVYATNDTISYGPGWFALTSSDVPSTLVGDFTDNFTNTFNQTETFESPNVFPGIYAITNVRYAYSLNATGHKVFKTYALRTFQGAMVFATPLFDDVVNFQNRSVDFQILLPAISEPYYFYLELV